MSRPQQTTPVGSPPATRMEAIAGLSAVPRLGSLGLLPLQTVMAFRILALCGKAGCDPVCELLRRFRSLSAVKAFLALAGRTETMWPERIALHRPCCRFLSPDESTLAQMVRAASDLDREAFGQVLDGFVRSERHDAIYDAAVRFVAEMGRNDWQ